jgi:Fe-S cluster assembly ATP-binding protein
VRTACGEPELDAVAFLKLARERLELVKMPNEFLKRSVNAGFSGGEKKRNEILQMAILEPRLAVLDETDSGLDIDALRIVADGINALRAPDRATILVTHYQRLLDYVEPDHVHVLSEGRIIRSGDKSLALELEQRGYGWIEEEAAA